MFPERDASKVNFFCETLVSAYSREFSNFFDKLKLSQVWGLITYRRTNTGIFIKGTLYFLCKYLLTTKSKVEEIKGI